MGWRSRLLSGGKSEGRPGAVELKNVLDFAQIAQSMLAKVDELEGHPGGREVPHQLPGGFGQQHLTTGAGCQEPGEAIERGGEVVAIVRCRGAGVQRHAHRDRTERAPVFGDQGALGGNRGQHRVERRGKGGLNGIADGLEADAIVGADRLVEKREVALDGGAHRRRVLLPTPGAPLDVREQKGDGAAGKVAHGDRSSGIVPLRLAWGFCSRC